ncbi:MAG: cytochrome [Variovorax sp.]|nr:cytochrome [Variovorax sp.]
MREAQKVWDAPVRLLHWALAAAVGIAWFAGEGALSVHEMAGYVALALVAARWAWGWRGGRFARFGQFVRAPGVVGRYALDVARHREQRHLGHNPLGGWMVVALLAAVAAVGTTGWLYTLDRFWGVAWLEALHRTLAWGLMALVALHVAGVVFTGRRHRENLVTAMLTGRKRPAGEDDVV